MTENWVEIMTTRDGELVIEGVESVEEINVFNFNGECVYKEYYPCKTVTEGLPEREDLVVVIKKIFGETTTFRLNSCEMLQTFGI